MGDQRRAVLDAEVGAGLRPLAVIGEFPAALNGKLATQLAGSMARDIIRAQWPVGALLGTEAELVERLGVSRSVFREAVRILEHQNVATMRRGPSGGLVVTAPDSATLTRAAELYLSYRQTATADLFASRRSVEAAVLELVGGAFDSVAAQRLTEALTADSQPHSHHFHRVLAELCGNPVLELFIDMLIGLTERPAGERDGGPPAVDGAARHSHDSHRAIVRALESGDVAAAVEELRRDLRSLEQAADPTLDEPATFPG